jgi:hypothetical protein
MSPSLLIRDLPAVPDVLAEWRWKIGGAAQVIELSLAGDAFLRLADGHVWWLDTGAGTLIEIAPSVAAFYKLLDTPKEAVKLLLAPVVEQFVRDQGPIPPGKCLGFTQFPVLGGVYTAENRWLAPIVEHFGITGDLHRQIRDLPDGAKVQIKIVE